MAPRAPPAVCGAPAEVSFSYPPATCRSKSATTQLSCAASPCLYNCRPAHYTGDMSFVLGTSDKLRYQPLLAVFAAAAVGVLLDACFPIAVWVQVALAVFAILSWGVCWRLGRSSLAACTALLLTAAVFGLWHHQCWYCFAADDLGFRADYEPAPVLIEGTLHAAPTRMPAPTPNPLRAMETGDRTRLDLRVTGIRDGQNWISASGNTTVIVSGHVFDLVAGDRVQIAGQLSRPAPAMNPGGFDYQQFCRGNRVLSLLRCESPSCVRRVARSPWWQPQPWIDRMRAVGEATLWRFISPRNAGLATAMFLGLRDELDPEQMEAFKETGTVHLLVISGLNVGILAGCVMLAFRSGWVSSHSAVLLTAVVTVLYTVMTGAQPPVVRATVLVLVFCIAKLTGRQGMAFNSLAAAALLVMAMNPVELFRPGTQLSFLAVAALIAASTPSDAYPAFLQLNHTVMHSLPVRLQLAYVLTRTLLQWVLVSLAVWIVVQPLVAARFNLITPSAILLGPILAIPVTMAMAAGFGVMAFGWLLPPVGAAFGFVCNFALTMVTAIVDWARETPFSRFSTAGPADWWLIGYYLLLAMWIMLPGEPSRVFRRVAAAVAVWTAIGVGAWLVPVGRTDRAHVAFLSVGHGLAVVVELPDGRTVLYDAGSLSSPELATRAVAGYLFTRRIHRIDHIVISHADIDHYNAIPQLIRQFPVGQISYGPTMFSAALPLRILRDAIVAADIPVRELHSGDILLTGEHCRIEVLHPPATPIPGSDNANSVVLRITIHDHSLLLTGDLEASGLECLMTRPGEPFDVVLVPHHGSRRSDPPGFSAWARAQHVVISGSLRDHANAVHAAYTASGAVVHHTGRTGATELELSGREIAVRSYLRQPGGADLQRFYNRQTAR